MSWQSDFDAGVKAYRQDPGQSLKGKNDVFRQGFYSLASAVLVKGYTHLITYELYVESLEKWVPSSFRTTADAVRRHRRALIKGGARLVKSQKIATKGK